MCQRGPTPVWVPSVPGTGPQEHPGGTRPGGPYGEDLVDAEPVAFEREGSGGHVQPPDAGAPGAGELLGPRPVGLQTGHPLPQGQRVVLPDRLDVTHLEPGPFELGEGGAGGREFAVRKDIRVDEAGEAVRALLRLRAAGDLVIEQPTARLEQ